MTDAPPDRRESPTGGGGGRNLGLAATVAIGIGGMVGGGIFSVLGLTVQVAGGGAYLSFAVSGMAVLLTAYSYARLSAAFPSRGGTVEFINQAFGRGLVAGSVNVLLWLGYLVMLSLYALAFGSYTAEAFGQDGSGWWAHAATSVVIVAFTGLNLVGAKLVGRVEAVLVYLKVTVLVLFVVVGAFSVRAGRVAPGSWPGPGAIVFAGALIYLAYEGFELIANAAEDVGRPGRTLPRAYFISVASVMVLYVAVTFVAVGNLSVRAIVEDRDYALAAAARPALGHAGFLIMAVTAAVSTASALNATLYGAAKFTYVIARSGELPREFTRTVWNKPVVGLLLTAGGTLVIANTVDLEGISLMGSAVFLIVFALANVAAVRTRTRTHAHTVVSVAGATASAGSFVALVVYAAGHFPAQLALLGGLIAAAVAIELAFGRGRRTAPDRPRDPAVPEPLPPPSETLQMGRHPHEGHKAASTAPGT